MPRFVADDLREYLHRLLASEGATPTNAEIVVDHIVDSSLAGHDSHGVLRIIQYFDEIRDGVIDPQSSPIVVDRSETGCTLEGNRSFGQVACHEAIRLAVNYAKDRGLGAVAVRQGNHSGRLGAWVEFAAQAGVIGIVTGSSGGGGQWVAPFGGREGRIGTNPVAIGTPGTDEFPMVLDMATCIAPEGKVRHSFLKGQSVPDGWLIDASGQPTNDPSELYATPRAAILPLGGPAGHKGTGLAVMVELLAGALTGAGCARPDVRHNGPAQGVLMVCISIERFRSLDVFRADVKTLVRHLQTCPPMPGVERVMVPGEMEYRSRLQRNRDGIPVPDDAWRQIRALGETRNIEPPAATPE